MVTNSMDLLELRLFIGEKIRDVRVLVFGESRKQFSRRIGLATSYLGKIERGEVLITVPKLVQIAIATSADLNYLVLGTANQKPSKKRKKLHQIIDEATSEEIDLYFTEICRFRSYFYKDRL